MKIIIIGAVASGTSAGAKARRNKDDWEITIYEKDEFISYSGCGLPYFIGGEVDNIDSLTPRDYTFFKKKYNIDVKTSHEIISVNEKEKTVEVKNLQTGEIFTDNYDKLIIATGATPNKPNITGINNDNVFFLRNVRDSLKIQDFISKNKPQNAIIVGTGFVGFELLESLVNSNIYTKIIEINNKITSSLDEDMAVYLENALLKKGIEIYKNTSVTSILKNTVELSNGNEIPCDMIILSTGVSPNTYLTKGTSIQLGTTGAIKVNEKMETSVTHIYACGDCVETFSLITNKPTYKPLGSTANKTGRIAGDVATGGNMKYKGNIGTSIFKIFDMAVAVTGLSESEALKEGYEIEVCHNIKPNKPEYMGGKEMVIKAVADKNTGRILGTQIVGHEGVDKRIDVFATLITYKAKVEELFHLDLAYAPPFSTTKDPVHYTGMILDNSINKNRNIITSKELENFKGDIQIIDTRTNSDFTKKGTVTNAINIPQSDLRNGIKNLDKKITTVTFCNKGVTGNASQNILLNNGFENVYNLSGGHKFYKGTQVKKIK